MKKIKEEIEKLLDFGFVCCKSSIRANEYHGWECSITRTQCKYLFPNSEACLESGELERRKENETRRN